MGSQKKTVNNRKITRLKYMRYAHFRVGTRTRYKDHIAQTWGQRSFDICSAFLERYCKNGEANDICYAVL